MMNTKRMLLLGVVPLVCGCVGSAGQVGDLDRYGPVVAGRRMTTPVSLSGRLLHPLPRGANATQEARLAEAWADLTAEPNDPARIVWLGRRLGYLRRMNEAIAVYTAGIEAHPADAPLYRHRGHRYISIRRFDKAIADLEKAAELIRGKPDEIEPDGLPNARNIPLTTTAFNVWYHLGLSRYLKGDFEGALRAYTETMKYSRRYDDNLVATTYWMYLALRRIDRHDDARALLDAIGPDMTIIENRAYHRLLLMYKGLLTPEALTGAEDSSSLDQATLGYGIGMWRLFNKDTEQALREFQTVVNTDQWPAFGFIAAEVDIHRLTERQTPR